MRHAPHCDRRPARGARRVTPTPPKTTTPAEPASTPAPTPSAETIAVDWEAGFSDASAQTMTASPGEVLHMTWRGNHDVYLMPSDFAVPACNFATTPGTQLAPPMAGAADTPASYDFTVPADAMPGSTIVLARTIASGHHCKAGQHLTITVAGEAPTPPAEPVPAPTTPASEGTPTSAPEKTPELTVEKSANVGVQDDSGGGGGGGAVVVVVVVLLMRSPNRSVLTDFRTGVRNGNPL